MKLVSLARKFGIRTRRQFRLSLRAVAIFFVVGSGYSIGVLTELQLFWWSVLPFAFLLVATILEFVLADFLAEQSYPVETEKKLTLLEQRLGAQAVQSMASRLEQIIKSFRACDTSQISGTIHVIVELVSTPEEKTRFGLLQLTDYVGPYGGERGRITVLEKGVIGRCARVGNTQFVNFSDQNEYRHRMVEEFGFSYRETNMRTTIARSYIAEPLKYKGDIIGVLYFFSTEPQVFPHAANASDLFRDSEHFVDLLRTISMI